MTPQPSVLSSIPAMIWPLGFGAFAVVLNLLPLDHAPDAALAPNFLLVTLGFWCVRQPWACPPVLVFLLGALNDLASDGPVGAELLALLIVTEAMRVDALGGAPRSLAVDWLRFSLAVTAHGALTLVILTLTLSPTPPIADVAARGFWTAAAYPIAVFIYGWLLGVRARPARHGLPDY